MKTITSIQRPVLVALLSAGLGAIVHAQQPKEQPSTDIENSDPFSKGAAATDSKSPKTQSAEMLDAQARILFARGETERAIAVQTQAVEKAKDNVQAFSETLAKYEGRPVDGPIARKLREIIIPIIDFEDITIEEAMDFLRLRSKELDAAEVDPIKKGINFVVRRPRPPVNTDPFAAAPEEEPASPRVKELRLRNVPLGVALKYICDSAGMRYKIDAFAVTLMPASDP